MVQISAKGPDAFLLRALKIVKTGFGQPSIFNTDAIVQELVRAGQVASSTPATAGPAAASRPGPSARRPTS
ncbi:MAG: hypothetical protein MZV63_65545 [Marinilabiliales bacterium]|nr:hypothetical protein [Marinilabiliales bacterium]